MGWIDWVFEGIGTNLILVVLAMIGIGGGGEALRRKASSRTSLKQKAGDNSAQSATVIGQVNRDG